MRYQAALRPAMFLPIQADRNNTTNLHLVASPHPNNLVGLGAHEKSAETTGDVVLGFLALRLHEDAVCFAEFHQFAQVHIGGVV